MRKNVIPKVLLAFILVILSGVILVRLYSYTEYRGKGTDIINNMSQIVLRIQVNKKCTPVVLNVYNDGTYELLTEYEACKPYQACTMQLAYTKSVKGKYTYDITKIFNDSIYKETDVEARGYEYEILTGGVFGSKEYPGIDYNNNYYVKKGKKNAALEEFLKELDINLDKCAVPNYV